MALIRTSGFVSDIIGRMGGSTFQRTQGGLIMRPQRAQRNSNTSLQQYNKVGINDIMLSWSALSQAERDQWQQYAIFRNIRQKKNQTKSISGHQLFIRENSLRYSMKNYGAIYANPIHSTPIMASPPNPITAEQAVINFADFNITHDLNIDNTIQGVIIWASAPLKQSQQSRYIKRVLMKVATLNGLEQNIAIPYTSKYGSLPSVGQYVSIEIAIYDSTVETYTRSTPVLLEVL